MSEYESKNSSPDLLRINGQSISFSLGSAFTFLGDDVLLYTHATHLNILNAMKKLVRGDATVKASKALFKEYGVKVHGTLTDDKINIWKELLNSLEDYILHDIRKKTRSGRVWRKVTLEGEKGQKTIVSFWCSQGDVTDNDLKLIAKTFETDELIWEGSDSKYFAEYKKGQTEDNTPKEQRKLTSAIAPQLSHDELLNILMRAHYDAQLSPFERRVARELQGIDPTLLKPITGGYPTAAEYNYRSRFSENYTALLNSSESGSSAFDSVIKNYIHSFDIMKESRQILDFEKILSSLNKELQSIKTPINQDDIFDPERQRHDNLSNAISFFRDLESAYSKSDEIRKRVQNAQPFPSSYYDLFRKLNAPGHPVRDGLILLNRNLL